MGDQEDTHSAPRARTSSLTRQCSLYPTGISDASMLATMYATRYCRRAAQQNSYINHIRLHCPTTKTSKSVTHPGRSLMPGTHITIPSSSSPQLITSTPTPVSLRIACTGTPISSFGSFPPLLLFLRRASRVKLPPRTEYPEPTQP